MHDVDRYPDINDSPDKSLSCKKTDAKKSWCHVVVNHRQKYLQKRLSGSVRAIQQTAWPTLGSPTPDRTPYSTSIMTYPTTGRWIKWTEYCQSQNQVFHVTTRISYRHTSQLPKQKLSVRIRLDPTNVRRLQTPTKPKQRYYNRPGYITLSPNSVAQEKSFRASRILLELISCY